MLRIGENLGLICPPCVGSSFFQKRFQLSGFEVVACLYCGGKHDLNHGVCEECSRRTIFTIIRNPINWIESCYRFFPKCSVFPGPSIAISELYDDNFQVFVDRLICRPGLIKNIFSKYVDLAHVILHNEILNKEMEQHFGELSLPKIERYKVNKQREIVWGFNQREALLESNSLSEVWKADL